MQTWAKRGIQSALVTGGLLMLGTGIASAQENVSPDAAPPLIDGAVIVPIDIEDNALGTILVGQRELPELHREISTTELTGANPLVRGVHEGTGSGTTSGITRGNTVQPDIIVPIHICGNAIAALGNATVETDCVQSTQYPDPITTDGSGDALSGIVVAAVEIIPVQVTGNAIAAVGNAEATTTAVQDTSSGGDITTSGEDGTLSGIIVASQSALPVQLTNNAVAGAGNATTDSSADNTAEALGSLTTNGDRSAGSGNVVAAPLAPIVAVNGNSVAGAGNADSIAENAATATAGSTTVGDLDDVPRYITTNGGEAVLAGTVAQPALAGPVSVDDNAVAGAGNGDASSATANDADAGGFSTTSGNDGSASGTVADAPIALPVSGGGNAVSAIGNTTAEHINDTEANAGGNTTTSGDRSVLGATTVSAAPAGAVDLCGDTVAGGGGAVADCENNVTSEAGGYNGTTGNDAIGGGNIGQAPVAVPAEVFGAAVGAAGTPTSTVSEDKDIRAGGTPNSSDDNGTVSSNVVTAPTAVGAQVFGDAVALVGNPNTATDSDTTLTAGGPSAATGKHGAASGNIVQAPTSNPAQVFGNTVIGAGNGGSVVDSTLASTSGGDATSNGEHGAAAGNVVSADEASQIQVFGDTVSAVANAASEASNDYSSVSGGDVTTTGDNGSVSGNGVGAAAAAPVGVFGDTVAGAGHADSNTISDTAVAAGGDHTTSAEDASLSGNLVTVPANAVPGVFGEPVAAAGGIAHSNSDSVLLSESGGDTETSGNGGSLTAHDITVPAEAAAQVYDVPVEVVGEATAATTDATTQLTGDEAEGVGTADATDAVRGIDLPVGVDSLMGATAVPNLSGLANLPSFNSLNQLPVNQLGDPTQLPVNQLGNPTQLPVNQFGDPAQLPVNQFGDPTQLANPSTLAELPVQTPDTSALLPTERSFGGELPLSNGSFGVNPIISGLLPLDPSARSLPTLPAAPIALPALPLVVPFAPIAQPRGFAPTVPSLPIPSLGDLPLGADAVKVPKVPTTERALGTPALAGLDTQSMFGNLQDTLQLPRI